MKKFFVLLLFLGAICSAAFADIADPVSSVVSSDKYLYVPSQFANQVIIYNTNNSPATAVAAINLDGSPRGLALSPDGLTLYISTIVSPTLKAYNARTGALIGSLTGGNLVSPKGIAVSPDGKRVYVVDSLANGANPAGRSIKVFDAQTRTFQAAININADWLYGIAVSPDNSMLAVTSRTSPGGIYIYNINQDISTGAITYSLKTSIVNAAGLVNPTQIIFSPESDRFYVRVHQTSGSYVDAFIYSGANFATSRALSLISADEKDLANIRGESMSLSSNGQKLYLTHYRTTTDEGEQASSQNKVHVYQISTVNTDGTYRTDWSHDWYNQQTNPSGKDSKMQNNITPHVDGLSAVPDGSRVWITSSDNGNKVYSKWTGFTSGPSGDLINPIPNAPDILHPEQGDDLLNYAGNAEVRGPAGAQYIIDYKNINDASWTNLANYTLNPVASLTDLLPGQTYALRAKMVVNNQYGPYAYAPQFKMAGPRITSIVGVDKNGNEYPIKKDGKWQMNIWEGYKIKGSGFGGRAIPRESVDGNEFNIHMGKEDYIIPVTSISNWTDNEINFVIPKKYKNGTFIFCSDAFDVSALYVKAFSINSNGASVSIHPAVSKVEPAEGHIGSTIKISGAFNTFPLLQKNHVYFKTADGSVEATNLTYVLGNDSDAITCQVPQGAQIGATTLEVFVDKFSTSHIVSEINTPISFTVTDPNPTITEIKKGESVVSEGYIYDSIKIKGSDFGDNPVVKDGAQYKVVFRKIFNPGRFQIITNLTVPGDRISNWTNNEIEMVIPRVFKDSHGGDAYVIPGAKDVVVVAYGKESNLKPFSVLPVITDMQPIQGIAGSAVDIYGAGFGDEEISQRIVSFRNTNGNYVNAIITAYESNAESDHIRCTVPQEGLNIGTPLPVKVTVDGKDTWSKYRKDNPTDVLFTVLPTPTPVIESFYLDLDSTVQGIRWSDAPVTEAAIYDHIKIKGANFGADPGDGNRDKDAFNVKINGVPIRDDEDAIGADKGLQVYSWKDTEIEIGIPRKIGARYIASGDNSITVTANDKTSVPSTLKIKPTIDSLTLDNGYAGDSITIKGTALGYLPGIGSRNIYFGQVPAGSGAGFVKEEGDVDGAGGSDSITVVVPQGLPEGLVDVTATVNTLTSNKKPFLVKVVPTPAITKFQVDTNHAVRAEDIVWQDTTDAVIYDHIKIVGTGFLGGKPAPIDGDMDTNDFNVTLSGYKIRDDVDAVGADKGLQVYSWKDTEIEIGIPRKIGQTIFTAGPKAIVVTANGKKSGQKILNIKPTISSLTLDNGSIGDTVIVKGTALGFFEGAGSRTVYFGQASAGTGAGFVQEAGDIDGAGGGDSFTVVVPQGLSAGLVDVTATVNTLTSNGKQFLVEEPTITLIQVKDDNLGIDYGANQKWGYVNSSVRVSGSGFGAPGIVRLRTKTNQYLVIPAEKVYSWQDGSISFGIPRRINGTFIDAGSIISVSLEKPNGDHLNHFNFAVRPKVYSDNKPINPEQGPINTPITIYGFGFGEKGTALKVYFGDNISKDAVVSERIIDNPLTGDGIDTIVINAPQELVAGTVYNIKVKSATGGDSNKNYTFTATETPQAQKPVIENFYVDLDKSEQGVQWSADSATEAVVYDHIKIVGQHFGKINSQSFDPGDGNRASNDFNVELSNGDIRQQLRIRDGQGDAGLQVYRWTDTSIEIGIPRKAKNVNGWGAEGFVRSGKYSVNVTANSLRSASKDLTIKPTVYAIDPVNGARGSAAVVKGTALNGMNPGDNNQNVVFTGPNNEAASASYNNAVQDPGIDEDGTGGADNTGGNDTAAISIPQGAALGINHIAVVINNITSNNDKTFTVLTPNAPLITTITPNAAPNTGDISVVVKGANFQASSTIALIKQGQPDINGIVTSSDLVNGTLTVSLPINGKAVGKYDVAITNPGIESVTLSKGFTVLDGTDPHNEVSQILDDFEGICVKYPEGYHWQNMDCPVRINDAYEGIFAGQIEYGYQDGGYRGYDAALTAEQNLSNFQAISFMLKTDAKSNGQLKIQIMANSADGKTKSFSIPEASYITPESTDGNYRKYTFLTSQFIEVDNGNVVPNGARFDDNKSRVVGYLIGFTGNSQSVAPIKIDFVAGNMYQQGPVIPADVPRNLRAVKNGNDINLSWDMPAQEPSTGYRIYTGKTPSTVTDLLVEVPAGTHSSPPHIGVVSDVDNHYYVVKAVSGVQESASSNMACVLKYSMNLNAAGIGNKHWISIPYSSSYSTLADILEDINGINDITSGSGLTTPPTKCDYIARLNPINQQYEAVWWDGNIWNSAVDNPATDNLEPSSVIVGEGFELSILQNFNLILAGANDPSFTFVLVHNSNIGNKHWISIPYSSSYSTLADILEDINGINDITSGSGLTTPPTKCDYIARLNPINQQYEAVWWDGNIWNSAVDNPATDNLEPSSVIVGEGFETSILNNLMWKPSSL